MHLCKGVQALMTHRVARLGGWVRQHREASEESGRTRTSCPVSPDLLRCGGWARALLGGKSTVTGMAEGAQRPASCSCLDDAKPISLQAVAPPFPLDSASPLFRGPLPSPTHIAASQSAAIHLWGENSIHNRHCRRGGRLNETSVLTHTDP